MNPSLTGHLRELLVAGKSADAAALEVLSRKDLADIVQPLVIQAARQMARGLTRKVEKKAFGMGLTWGDGQPRVAAIKALVAETFPLPSGGFVAWVDATAEEHLERAKWQRDHAAQSVADAERHEIAAKKITDAGVACLRDLIERVA